MFAYISKLEDSRYRLHKLNYSTCLKKISNKTSQDLFNCKIGIITKKSCVNTKKPQS